MILSFEYNICPDLTISNTFADGLLSSKKFGVIKQSDSPNGYIALNSDTPLNFTTIDIDKISHVVQDLKLDGDTLTGQISVLNTPFGNILKRVFHTVRFVPPFTGERSNDKFSITGILYIDAIHQHLCN